MDAGAAALIGAAIGVAGGLFGAWFNARMALERDRIERAEGRAEILRGLMVEIYNDAADPLDWLSSDRTEDSVLAPWEEQWLSRNNTAIRAIREARAKAAIVAARSRNRQVRELADEIHADLGVVDYHWGQALDWARFMHKNAKNRGAVLGKKKWEENCVALDLARNRLRGAGAAEGSRPLGDSTLHQLRDLVRVD